MDIVDWGAILEYDETSASCLRWKIDRMSGMNKNIFSAREGDVAGSVEAEGYYSVKYNYKKYKAHRIVWEMFNGEILGDLQIDHINRVRTDNKIYNLRLVNPAENSRNQQKSRNNKTGVTGVNLQRRYTEKGEFLTFRAMWNDTNGVQVSKNFAVLKYGYDEAFDLACKHRIKMIEEFNSKGAGYSVDHGT